MHNGQLIRSIVYVVAFSLIIGCATNRSNKLGDDSAQITNHLGYATFQFKVHDGHTYSEDSYTMTIDVEPVQDAPAASNTTVTIDEDTPYTFAGSDFNFQDADGDTMIQIQITLLGSAGSLRLNGLDVAPNDVVAVADIDAGNLVFEPMANANGDGYDAFQFKVHDGTQYSVNEYTMTVNVIAVNDSPTSSEHTIAISDQESYTFQPADFAFFDNDGDEMTKVQIVSLANTGGLRAYGQEVNPEDDIPVADLRAGTLTFDPTSRTSAAEHEGFQFRVHDGSRYSDSSYTMTIDISTTNTSPRTANNTVAVSEDTSYAFQLSDFPFIDADGDVMTHVQITSLELDGSLTMSGEEISVNDVILVDDITSNKLEFTPTPNAVSAYHNRFHFRVHDGAAYSESECAMAIDIAPVNDAPTASNGSVSTNEDVVYVFAPSDFNFMDVDGDTMAHIQITSLEVVGSLKLNGVDLRTSDVIPMEDIRAGKLIFDPQPNWNHSVGITFRLSDKEGRTISPVTLNVDIEPDSGATKVAIEPVHD